MKRSAPGIACSSRTSTPSMSISQEWISRRVTAWSLGAHPARSADVPGVESQGLRLRPPAGGGAASGRRGGGGGGGGAAAPPPPAPPPPPPPPPRRPAPAAPPTRSGGRR